MSPWERPFSMSVMAILRQQLHSFLLTDNPPGIVGSTDRGSRLRKFSDSPCLPY